MVVKYKRSIRKEWRHPITLMALHENKGFYGKVCEGVLEISYEDVFKMNLCFLLTPHSFIMS